MEDLYKVRKSKKRELVRARNANEITWEEYEERSIEINRACEAATKEAKGTIEDAYGRMAD